MVSLTANIWGISTQVDILSKPQDYFLFSTLLLSPTFQGCRIYMQKSEWQFTESSYSHQYVEQGWEGGPGSEGLGREAQGGFNRTIFLVFRNCCITMQKSTFILPDTACAKKSGSLTRLKPATSKKINQKGKLYFFLDFAGFFWYPKFIIQ